jgi:hypothetical protein
LFKGNTWVFVHRNEISSICQHYKRCGLCEKIKDKGLCLIDVTKLSTPESTCSHLIQCDCGASMKKISLERHLREAFAHKQPKIKDKEPKIKEKIKEEENLIEVMDKDQCGRCGKSLGKEEERKKSSVVGTCGKTSGTVLLCEGCLLVPCAICHRSKRPSLIQLCTICHTNFCSTCNHICTSPFSFPVEP